MKGDPVRSPCGMNMVAFFDAWAKIQGEIHGMDVRLDTITHKDTGEVLYSANDQSKAS